MDVDILQALTEAQEALTEAIAAFDEPPKFVSDEHWPAYSQSFPDQVDDYEAVSDGWKLKDKSKAEMEKMAAKIANLEKTIKMLMKERPAESLHEESIRIIEELNNENKKK